MMNFLCKVVSFFVILIVVFVCIIFIEFILVIVWIIFYELYFFFVGVIGCKVNMNCIVYWFSFVDCNDICVCVSYEGCLLNFFKVDIFFGVFDIFYDVWNYFGYGVLVIDVFMIGGEFSMEY